MFGIYSFIRTHALQARYDVRTNSEPIIICSVPHQCWTKLEPILNQYFLWLVRPLFGQGSHSYVRIRSFFGSAEPILNQKCLQGGWPSDLHLFAPAEIWSLTWICYVHFWFTLIRYKEYKNIYTLRIADVILTSTLQAPLLGITFDTELNFKPHVLGIINKAVFQLQTLRRLCGLLDTNSKLTILKAFIRSNFTYCCHIWYFTLSTLKDRLERLQYRGLKYVYNDYNSDYEILLKRANLDSIDLLIQKVILVDIYKAVNNIGATYLQDLFQFSQNSTRRKDRDLVLPRVDSVTYGIHSLRYHGPKLWAAMPREAKTAPDLDAFKAALVSFKGFKCKCAMCKYKSKHTLYYPI